MKEQLLKLREKLEEKAGQWNGDESGSMEDMAHACIEGVEHIDGLVEILGELNME